MATTVIEVYDVQEWDGGDRQIHKCYIVNKEDAEELAGKHGAVVKRSLVIHDTKADYLELAQGEIKRRALEKLTPLERQALGL